MEATEKTCSKCGKTKPLGEFYKAAGCIDGRRGECKACFYIKQRARKQTPEARAQTIEYMRTYRAENREHLNARQRERYALNDNGFRDKAVARRSLPNAIEAQRKCEQRRRNDPEHRDRQRERKQSPTYKEWRKGWYAKRRDSDESFRLAMTLRSLLKVVTRATGKKKTLRTEAALGYSTTHLRDRIACQFQPGMSWDNHGEWHIDHKKPVAEFLRQGIIDPRTINMLCNLQPMWAVENIVKKDHWPRPVNDNKRVAVAA